MEVDFDKEIDALMRSSGGGRTITISEFAAPHIDADTLNAFAENTLPDAARRGYMTHLADCDGCRKTFAELISMNAEAEPVSAVSAIPAVFAETSVPWYKSLFAIQNLAYGMGALVIAFAGFLGYMVLQNTGTGSGEATISQVTEQRQASGPMVSESDTFAANTISNAANSSSAANANAGTAVSANKQEQPAELAKGSPANTIVGEDLAIASERSDRTVTMDGITTAPPPPPAAAAPVTRPEPRESRPEDDAVLRERRDKSADLRVMRQDEQQIPSAGNMPNTQAGPSKNVQRDNRASGEREMARKRAAVPALGRIASPSKTVGGRNFSRRENVWYDSAYSGQATTNVRRRTEDYSKLDSGLRSIAESLDGIVVVVWKSKAYRIQ